MKSLMVLFFISSLATLSWSGTSAQDPKVKEMRSMYEKASLVLTSEELPEVLGKWECTNRTALRDQYQFVNYSPLYDFSMWENLLTHNAQSETMARTYIAGNWGYVGALGNDPQMTIDSLRFNPDGTIIAERLLTSVLYNDNKKLGERSVSHREYITEGYAHCRKITLKSALLDEEMTNYKNGFSLEFNPNQEIPTFDNTAVFVVQAGKIYPGIWAWRRGVFIVLSDMTSEGSDVKLDPSLPSCQVHRDGSTNRLPESLSFKAMKYSGEMFGLSLYNSLSTLDESTFMNCVPGKKETTQKVPFTTDDLHHAWGDYLLTIRGN